MRIFLDANILFSAAKSKGAIRQLLERLIKTGHDCCVDGYVLEEARRNLALKAHQGLTVLEALLVEMHLAPAQPGEATFEAALPLPEKDRPVLAAAIHQRCAVLVTGDRTHFGRHYGKTVHGVTIHSPRSIAEALL
jgi:predicted nucleic acid-binding protein